jgi:hypothetical protein
MRDVRIKTLGGLDGPAPESSGFGRWPDGERVMQDVRIILSGLWVAL